MWFFLATPIWLCHSTLHLVGDARMFATILVGRYLSIQGRIVHRLPGGLVAVRVGSQTFVGRPLPCKIDTHAA